MKINVEFDLTPEEFRRALGLPDVEAFQQELLDRIQKQMESGVEGYDPMSLMQPFLQQPGMPQGLSRALKGLASFGTYQQMMLDMLRKAGSQASRVNEDDAAAKEKAGSRTGAESKSGTASSASASSRSRRSQ